jgi:hypothetical protein
MKSTWFRDLTLLAIVIIVGHEQTSRAADRTIDFRRDIRPILSNNCIFCHGPDEKERKGGLDGLRLDTPDGMTVDLGEGKQAVVAGKPELSVLLHPPSRLPRS